MKKTRTTLTYLTITFMVFSGLLCAIHTKVPDIAVPEQLTSAVMDLTKAIAEALREEYTYTYTFPDGIHFYIGEKGDDEECNKPYL